MATDTSSSPTAACPPKKYDVFISFRGEDTRSNFTSHLRKALYRNQIVTYIDNTLHKGDEISLALMQAIQDSFVSVVVFSKNYATSTWCLDELTKILQCKRDQGQLVIPVFYKVEPTHVRHQTGPYQQAFEEYDRKLMHNQQKIYEWKAALTKAASLVGWDSRKFRDEDELIQKIVRDLLRKLKYRVDSIREICPLRENWKIKARVIRLWFMPSSNLPEEINGIEMVLQDAMGSCIHASVKHLFVNKFKSILIEGDVFVIRQFRVSQNSGSCRTTSHAFKINFQFSTFVWRDADDPTISQYGFSFCPFSDIISRYADDNYLVDVIGKLYAVGKLKEICKDGTKYKKINIELEDIESNRLSCTLWGDFANKVANYVGLEIPGPIIVIIQWCKIKDFSGSRKISNSWYASRLFINADLPESSVFIDRIKELGDGATQIPSQLCSQTTISHTEDLLQTSDHMTIDEIINCRVEMSCLTLATVMSIETRHGWFYNSCKTCTRKIVLEGAAFFCKKCNKIVASVVPRFKIVIKVIDDTGSALFVLFDREASKFLQSSADDLRNLLYTTCGDSNQVPDCFGKFFGQKFIFKVHVNERNAQIQSSIFPVLKMSNDDDLVQSYSTFHESPIEFDHGNLTQCLSEVDKTLSTSTNIESEMGKNSENITPAKRASLEIAVDNLFAEDIVVQMSSNVNKIIKREK